MLAGLVGRVYMGCERFKGWNLFLNLAKFGSKFWLKLWLKIQKGFEIPHPPSLNFTGKEWEKGLCGGILSGVSTPRV